MNTPQTTPLRPMLGLLCLLLAASGCASTGLGKKDVLRQYDNIARLDAAVAAAAGERADLLAPKTFEQMKQHLARAFKQAQQADKAGADRTARAGLILAPKVRAHIDRSKKNLAEVLRTRERAEANGAPELMRKEFEQADKALSQAAELVERGQAAQARERQPQLMERYASLELRALKRGMAETARTAIRQAKEADAEKYARRTLKRAEEELSLVVSILEADRTQTDKANRHAQRSVWQARRATEITRLAKWFEQKEYDREDMVLWHQQQLAEIRKPLGGELPFDHSNARVVQTMRNDIRSLLSNLTDMRKSQARNQEQLAAMEKQLAEQGIRYETETGRKVAALNSVISAQEEARRETERRYDGVRALFNEDEAEVLRKGDDVLLRLYGFRFQPGRSDIEAQNFALLHKVETAISKFPDCNVVVSGHTDTTGSMKGNRALSEQRAVSVATFLTETGNLEGSRVRSEGMGADSPVASNKTAKGRAKNRRIEVQIQPKTQGTASAW